MTFQQFATRVTDAGLQAVECSPKHWKIKGGVVEVNYYHATKKGDTMYINGTAGGVFATIDKALSAARGSFKIKARHKRRVSCKQLKRNRKIREQLLRKQKCLCAICGKPIEKSQQSLDHKIPLSKGGGNGTDNLQVVHRKCDSIKSNHWPFKAEASA